MQVKIIVSTTRGPSAAFILARLYIYLPVTSLPGGVRGVGVGVGGRQDINMVS